MSYWKVDNIRCPNCNYAGPGQVRGHGANTWILAIISILISFLFWPLFFVSGPYILYIMFSYRNEICPSCKWEHPVPVKN